MSNNSRELTGREKQRIRKLVISLCANYDKEYGCLPLDCDCPMLGICFTNSASGRRLKSNLWQRDKIVAGSLWVSVVAKIKTA